AAGRSCTIGGSMPTPASAAGFLTSHPDRHFPAPFPVSRFPFPVSRMSPPGTPASLGFRMPAEWEPHHATWLGWPHNRSDWPGKFAPIPWVYAEIVRKLTPGEIARILVSSATHERQARGVLARAGVDLGR